MTTKPQPSFADVIGTLRAHADPQKAEHSQRFFKTQKGQYGEGDIFWGISVPNQRIVAKKFQEISLDDLTKLFLSEVHEHRLTAGLILTYKYPKADSQEKERLYQFYLKQLDQINNWDIVDLTAPKIMGEYLITHPQEKTVLYDLIISSTLWRRRVAILATLAFIRHGYYTDTFDLIKMVLDDPEDLIHKTAGWMLREIGKKDGSAERFFLDTFASQMPRTMLRYAIEKFDSQTRARYLALS